jgi:hypothetical protein
MAVMRLSSISTVAGALFQAISMRELMPVWRKVESPMTATTRFCSSGGSARTMPEALLTEAPMQTQVSMAFKGGMKPRV